jgi:hypothetical protein
MTTTRTAALVIGLLAGCTGTITREGVAPDDHLPPTVEVQTPERGTLTGERSVTVTGRASDAESVVLQVMVNGTLATLADDGSFQATITLDDGVTLLETVATDGGGNTASDARAILAGNLVDQTTPVADAIAAVISPQAMNGLADLVNSYTSGIDLSALARSYNPVVNTGDSCNDYKAYVDSVTRGPIEVSAAAATGGIQGRVTIRDLVIRGHIDFRAVCISGSANYTVTADAYDAGSLIAPALADGTISIGLQNVTSNFRGFNVDVSGVPGFVEDRFEGAVRDKVAAILRDKIAQVVPPLATQFLDGFVSKTYEANLLGQTVQFSFWPSAMSWTEAGGSLVLDSNTSVAGVTGTYVSTPSERPSDADLASNGLRIALADDVFNQLLASVWSSGALEDTLLPGDQSGGLGGALGAEVDSATITMMLPPVTSFDTTTGTARLTLGDLVVDAYSVDGGTLASFAVSAEIDLAVTTAASGQVQLVTGHPRILAQVLEQSSTLLVPLDSQKAAAIAELAIKTISLKADELLGDIPVPGLANATIASPTFQPVSGYLMMGGELQFE